MRLLLVLSALFFWQPGNAQYYYNDIVGTKEMNLLMSNYTASKVKSITAEGYDPKGAKASDYYEFHEIKENGTALKVSNIVNFNKTVTYSRFDSKGRVISIIDSSTAVQNNTVYSYDDKDRVKNIKNTVNDSSGFFNHTEIHEWYYAESGLPEKMLRIIKSDEGSDTVQIICTADEYGNIGEEKTFKKGIETGSLFYYYDDKNRLTDIVRYNTKAMKLLPDVMFEYDEAGRVAQKITTTSSLHMGYLIWRYIYDNKGLKTKEAVFNKDKQPTGKIEYRYTFGQ